MATTTASVTAKYNNDNTGRPTLVAGGRSVECWGWAIGPCVGGGGSGEVRWMGRGRRRGGPRDLQHSRPNSETTVFLLPLYHSSSCSGTQRSRSDRIASVRAIQRFSSGVKSTSAFAGLISGPRSGEQFDLSHPVFLQCSGAGGNGGPSKT